jgi:hypothetical protein
MSNIEKPTPSLEVIMQKYFKVFAVLLIAFVIWRMFSTETVESTFDRSSPSEAHLKAVISAAVEDALNKRDIPVISDPHEATIQTTSDSYTIRIPKTALQAASDNIVIRNANSVFTIGYSQVSGSENVDAQPVSAPNDVANDIPQESPNAEINSENATENEKSSPNTQSDENPSAESSVTSE